MKQKFLENLKQGFKRTISCNKYISEIKQPKTIILSFKNGDYYPARNSLDEYYVPLVQVNDFNPLISMKPFFDQPVKNK